MTMELTVPVYLDGKKIVAKTADEIANMDPAAIRAGALEDKTEKPLLVTVRDVEIVSTGIEYPAASGPVTFTEEDLAEAVAAVDDPAVSQPRVKLGHDDMRFDGEPALGKVVNMHLSEDRQTIIGDLVGVPRWLGEIMASAYPSRSIEGNFNLETVTGHSWRLVISALALLGVVWPGVSTLEDIQALYSPEGPEGVEVFESFESKEEDVSVKRRIAAARGGVQAAVNVDDIRRAYFDTLDGAQLWWWVRGIYLDPNELIVDDDEGQLYRVPFTINGEDIEFDDPVEIKIQFVDAKTAGAAGKQDPPRALALVSAAGREAAIYASRSESRPESINEEESGMTPEQIRLLRTRLGLSEEQLPDDASQEQINAVLAETPEPAPGEGEPNSEPGADPNVGGQPAEAEPSTEGEPGAEPQTPEQIAAAASNVVTVPKEVWEGIQASAARGAAVADKVETEERVRILDDAIRAGKVRPADRQSYQNGLDNPATTEQFKKLLTAPVEAGGLAPNIVPVTERGVNPSDEETVAAGSAYDTTWLSPQEQARIERAKSPGGRIQQAQEG